MSHSQGATSQQYQLFEDGSLAASVRSSFSRSFPGFNFAEVPINMSESTELRTTPIVVLFGPAGDPLPSDIARDVLSNSSRESGLGQFVADVVIPDIISSNGVIHVIDHLLVLPMNLSTTLFQANKSAASLPCMR